MLFDRPSILEFQLMRETHVAQVQSATSLRQGSIGEYWGRFCKRPLCFPNIFAWSLTTALLAFAPELGAKTLHVRQDGGGDALTIRSALLMAESNDTILVSPGYYWEPPIYLAGTAIHLISVSGAEETTIRLLKTSPDDVTVIEMQNIVGPCSIVGFTITGASGGFLDAGGAISCNNSALLIKDNIIINNWCANSGGICCYGTPAPVIHGNLIYANQQWANGTIGVVDCSPLIEFNTIVSNVSTNGTSAICIGGPLSRPIVRNNIIALNMANDTGAAIAATTPVEQIVFQCNDMWSNYPRDYDETFPDQTGMNGNISLNPLFCGLPNTGNYYLQNGSPCVEQNVPASCSGSRMGCYPSKCTVGIQRSSWGDVKSLFKGGKK